ncbi:MAG: autotransporter outer membrane beta-barrel domain-containing protein [Puniceicoccales bacterium]|jgi:outer membrane autotransporter protein|nr:autotransporter outer membrane beta-barrel domain-containing protein [Puniceicoccales bacterium]
MSSASSLSLIGSKERQNKKYALSQRALIVGGMLTLGSLASQAATLQWNPSSGDGDGVWDDATASWFDGSGQVLWQAGDVAEFSGTGGTITLGSAVSAEGLGFLAGDFTLEGQGHVLSLANTSPTEVNVASGRVVIDAKLSGTGSLQKTGAGTLVLKGEQSYAGTIISGGTVELADIGILKPRVGSAYDYDNIDNPYGNRTQYSFLIDLRSGDSNSSTISITQNTVLKGIDFNADQKSDNGILGNGVIAVSQGATLKVQDFDSGNLASDGFCAIRPSSGALKIQGDGDVIFENNRNTIYCRLSSDEIQINTNGSVSFIKNTTTDNNAGSVLSGKMRITSGSVVFSGNSFITTIHGGLVLTSENLLKPSSLSGEGFLFLYKEYKFENSIIAPTRDDNSLNDGLMGIRAVSAGDFVFNNMTLKGVDGYLSANHTKDPMPGFEPLLYVQGTLTADIDNVGYFSPTENTVTVVAPLAGGGNLVKKGLGTLLLNGANTYTGGTVLNEGTLVGNVPDNSAFTVAAGATYFSGDSTRDYADPQDRRFSSLNGAGVVDMKNQSLAIGAGDFAAGTIRNAATLTKISDGTADDGWFTVGNVSVDDVSVEAGALEVGSEKQLSVSNVLTVSDGATLALTANTTLPSVLARELVIGMAGTTLDISGYTSETPVTLIRTQDGILGDFSRITLGGQALSDTVTLDTFASATVNRSGDSKSLEASVGLVWNNTATDSAHGTFNVASGTFTVDSILADNVAATSGDAGGAFGWDGKSLTKTGTGILVLAERNTYAGSTTINQGTLRLGDGVNRDFSGNISEFQDGAIFYVGTEAYQKNASGGRTALGENKAGPITGPIVNNGSLIINWANYWAHDGALTGSGDLILEGAGSVMLRGGSYYAGAVYVQNGVLLNKNMTFQNTVTMTGGLILNNQNGSVRDGVRQINGKFLNGGTISGEVVIEKGDFLQRGTVNGGISVGTYGTLQCTNGTILGDVRNQGQILFGKTPSGQIDNSIPSFGVDINIDWDIVRYNSIQLGSSPLELRGMITNEASGKLVVTGGTISGEITNFGKLYFAHSDDYTHDRIIDNKGEFVLGSSRSLTFSTAIIGTGSLEKTGTGKVILSTFNTYTGATAIKAGTLEAQAANVFSQSERVTVGDSSGSTTSSSTMFDMNKNNQSIRNLDMQGGIVRLGPEYPKSSTEGGSGSSGSTTGSSLIFVGAVSTDSTALILSGNTFSGSTIGNLLLKSGTGLVFSEYDYSLSIITITGNSPVRYQTLNNTPADTLVPEQFATLQVGQLSGSGVFQFRANLLSGGHDQLVVTDSASGQHFVDVSFLYDSGSMANQTVELIQIDDSASTATFTLRRGPLSGGLRAYTLEQGSALGSGYSDSSYYFTNLNDTLSATGSVVIATSVDSSMLWLTQLDNLHKRMGELRLGGTRDAAAWDIWARGYAQQVNMKAEVTGLAYKSYMYGGDVGADKAWQMGDSGTLFTGIYTGYGHAKRDFDQGSSGDTDNIYGGVYGTWIHLSGWYVDVVAKVQNFDNSFEAIDGWGVRNNGSYKNWGYGVSVETGYPFAFGDKWFVEPIVQLAYTRLTDADYATDTGVGVEIDSADVLQARGMVRFGKVIQMGESILQPYVKIGAVGQTSSGGDVHGSGGTWSADLDGVRGEAGAGVAWLIDTANQVYVDYEASFGDSYTKPWALNFGFRRQF